jgi:CubicO group peptidase (beta-lactamase class C family)
MRLATIVIALALTSCSATAIPDPRPRAAAEGPHAASITQARSVLDPLLREYPALSVAVAVNGELVFSEGEGWADVEARRQTSSATIFRIYSTSKSITSALAMRLAEEKRVDLDAPIGRYLSDLPAAISPLTLRQLLAHRGGIRHYRDGEWLSVSRKRCAAARDALAPFLNDPLVAEAGTKFTYSSFGYVLASAVLEAAAGRPFYDLLTEKILEPAGMKSTTVEHRADASALAKPYEKGPTQAVNADNSCKFGAGGLVGTSEDLARFGIALSEGRLVSKASLEEMSAGQPSAPGRPDYGLGFMIEKDPVLGALAIHSGGALGGRSFLLISRDRRIVVALAGNVEGASLQKAAIEIAKGFVK